MKKSPTKLPNRHQEPHFAVDTQNIRLACRTPQVASLPLPREFQDRNAWAAAQLQALVSDPDGFDHTATYKKHTFLEAIVLTTREDWLETALSLGSPVDQRDDLQRTALHHAAQGGLNGMIERLLAAGADLEAKDGNHNTPLHMACQVNWEQTVALLIAKGANLEARTLLSETTPLIESAQRSLESMLVVLEAGADKNASSKHGETALMAAICGGNPEAAQRLIDAGVDLDAIDTEGHSVLWHALQREEFKTHPHHDLFQDLLDAGANLHVSGPNGFTLLHCAAELGRLDQLLALLDRGLEPHAQSLDGHTVQTLLMAKHPEIVPAFREAVLERQLPQAPVRKAGPRF